ncbi:hypothetical protein K438DRAFT_1973999 [Mycena galopus ATCC 62051]|nr:hypothetical protein K438DRAFT_1973999 [Mycena galopus ATCC 62051]
MADPRTLPRNCLRDKNAGTIPPKYTWTILAALCFLVLNDLLPFSFTATEAESVEDGPAAPPDSQVTVPPHLSLSSSPASAPVPVLAKLKRSIGLIFLFIYSWSRVDYNYSTWPSRSPLKNAGLMVLLLLRSLKLLFEVVSASMFGAWLLGWIYGIYTIGTGDREARAEAPAHALGLIYNVAVRAVLWNWRVGSGSAGVEASVTSA